MIIVKPSVTLEWITSDALGVIERAGRTCYQSEPGGDPAAFVRMLIKQGHESVIEHASASFRIVTDRGVTHELVRHRLVSYSQESTRYCRYQNGIAVIQPPGLRRCEAADPAPPCRQLSAEPTECPWHCWYRAVVEAEESYTNLLALGLSPQIARSVLPTCTKTQIVTTANLREWRHIIRLRTAPAAHPQMREIACAIRGILFTELPVVFEDLMAKETYG